ncbi:MAG: aminotransferase class I/II-fold pyridoxal phosphate-dependent enzyme [Frankia sp.]
MATQPDGSRVSSPPARPSRAPDAPGNLDHAADGVGDYAQLARMRGPNPMYDVVVDEVAGRRVRVGDHWLIDFASCNYLGFDLDPEIAAAVPVQLGRWGTHPSWSRMIASPRLAIDIEDELADLLGAPDCLVLPTITHIHGSVLPVLAAGGQVFVEAHAHRTIHDGALTARARGARIRYFRESRLDHLDRMLNQPATGPRVVCTDGVNSMTGNPAPLAELARITREHGALLYIDDAHGFGVIGERRVDETSPYGMRGNAIVRHLGLEYEGIVLVGGFSKAYSSLLAFVACPTATKNLLKVAAAPYIFSGPPPTASLATVLAGFRVNATRGDAIRARLYRLTRRLLDGLDARGIAHLNRSGFPVTEIPLADADDLDGLGHLLFERGLLVTLVPYPVVTREQVGFRLQVTAANTDEEITDLLAVLDEVAERFALRAAT